MALAVATKAVSRASPSISAPPSCRAPRAREGHDESQRETGNQHRGAAALTPRADCCERAGNAEARLEHGGTAIARAPLTESGRRPQFQASRMFDEVDVERSASEQRGTEGSDHL